MRSDYALYVVAIIFFAITGISYAVVLTEFERNLSVVLTAVAGLLFAGLGYTQRPRKTTTAIEVPPATPTSTPTPAAVEVPKPEKTEVIVETAPAIIELTAVKGIKEKRAEQLKALGINNVQELANASANDLAAKLKISPKFTEKWIENAKELVAKS
jgi:predicted flap endonuclease-1-like 5' DNA nuclease